MVANAGMLAVFRRVIDDSRRICPPAPTLTHPKTSSNCLPAHLPLLPLLLDHKIPLNTAKALSESYDFAALQLKRKTESLCLALSDNAQSPRMDSILNAHKKILRRWATKTLNAAMTQLGRSAVDLDNWQVVEISTIPARKLLSSSNRICPPHRALLSDTFENEKDFLSLLPHEPPVHAFPTVYPPPVDQTTNFIPISLPVSTPTWRRPSSSPSASTNGELDMNSLSYLFSTKLTLHNHAKQSPVADISIDSSCRSPSTPNNNITLNASDAAGVSSPQKIESVRPVKSLQRKPFVQRSRVPLSSAAPVVRSRKEVPSPRAERLTVSHASTLSPASFNMTTTPFTFTTKITGFSRQPIPPGLDTTSPIALPDKSPKPPSSISPNLASAISRSLPQSGCSRKVAPLPKRMPTSAKETIRRPSTPSSFMSGRTPSLASISSDDSDSSSLNHCPVTPPLSHSELMFQDPLLSPEDSFLTRLPDTVTESHKSTEAPSSFISDV